MYNVIVEVLVSPVEQPNIIVSCEDQTNSLVLVKPTWFKFEYNKPQGTSSLTVELKNKQANDAHTAVIIEKVILNGIESHHHTYEGFLYYPNQTKRDTYLDRNGYWQLNFTVPVFTWMHQVQGLGWIYD
jgi:hypothetical protein